MNKNEDKERHDIFNPKYKEKKKFLRKDNIHKLFIIIGLLTIFIWGSRDYIYGRITNIEIRNMKYQVVDKPFINISGKTGYIIVNHSPFNVKLEIVCDAKNFQSSYNNTVLIPNQLLYICFSGDISKATEIIIEGVKVE